MRRISFVTAALLLVSSAAWACPPPPPIYDDMRPAAGEAWPANAAVIFEGTGLAIEQLQVAVDGVPARLVWAEEVPGGSAFVEPTPHEGAQVRIEGNPCDREYDGDPADLEMCGEVMRTYRAGPPDEVAPADPVAFWFDIYDHADIPGWENELCLPGGEVTWYMHVVVGPLDSRSLEYLQVEEEDEGRWYRVDSMPLRPGGPARVDLPLLKYVHSPDGDDPNSRCWRVSVVDQAGNVSRVALERCAACHIRTEDVDLGYYSGPPEEPTWTAADRLDGAGCVPEAIDNEGDADAGEPAAAEGAPATGGAADAEGPAAPEGAAAAGGAADAEGPAAPEGVPEDGGGAAARTEGRGCQSTPGSAPLAALTLLFGLRRRRIARAAVPNRRRLSPERS